MKYRLYNTSYKAWDAMLAELLLAKKSIYIEMFIFLDDTKETHDFVGILERKAKQGLSVIIIVDFYGSFHLSSNTISRLKSAGVDFLFYNYWFRATHRKIMIIDERIAFLGGVNIKKNIKNWHDLQIRLEGRIVKPIIRSFARAYYKAGGKNQIIRDYYKKKFSYKLKASIIDNWPQTFKNNQINYYYKQKINEAKFLIQIATPYFLPPRWLINHLVKAINRGVKIEILVPKKTDISFLNKINFLNACRLSALGLHIFFTKKMNHAKIMLIDNTEGVVGSQNLDILSFYNFNAEIGVFFSQKQAVKSLQQVINNWKKEANYLDVNKVNFSFIDKFLNFIFRLFYPIF
jgi:cardiolipin synthase A/B